ncbi:protein kinase domain-containing protein [Halalkalibacter flavus]|uniref:protein kinase domain-containing protein n=1 Tax=Halalkalibacter flavus TaxID=3090668 RepID=UPI002FC7F2ED
MEETKLGRYIVDLNCKGRGTHGKVYWGYNIINNRKVAIKELNNIKEAKKEAFIMKTYGNFKYLPYFYDFYTRRGKAYIVMEYIGGDILGTTFWKSIGKKRPIKLSTQITINILHALNQLHNNGYAHRDLIPQNVMIYNLQPKTVKVIDFTLARPLTTASLQNDLRKAALMCLYLINGKAPLNKNSAYGIGPFAVSNSKLKEHLTTALTPTNMKNFKSAKEFIEVLKPFA